MPWEQPPRPAKVWTYADEPTTGIHIGCSDVHQNRPKIRQSGHSILLQEDPAQWEALADALWVMAQDYREGAGGE